jgi:hypothetical protein
MGSTTRKSSADYIHECSCGKTYTIEEWRKLPLVGTVDYGEGPLELRNCTCRSTRTVEIDALNLPTV